MSKKITRPVSIIPFWLNNIEDFLPDSSYPNLHPKSKAYDDYWRKQTQDCLLGLWGNDSVIKDNKKIGGFRWMTPNINFYVKHTVIEKEIEGQTAKGTAKPDLRDIDWFLGYDISTCDGFSGFAEDKEFTAFRPVGMLERGEKITNSDKILLDRYADILKDKYGRYKKYVDAREMMYKTYDEPLGDPLWLNECQDYQLLSTRRVGKSSIIINAGVTYKFVFNGARTLDQFYDQSTSTTCVVGSGNSGKTKEFFTKFNKTYDYLRTTVGSYNDGRSAAPLSGAWWWKIEGSVAKENSFITNSVKAEGKGAGQIGPGSKIWHVTYANSASQGAGTSSNLSVVEECGLTPDVEDIHAENAPTHKSDYKFGWSADIGTGGDFEMIEGSKKMFHNPAAYTILPCKNIFIKGGKDTSRFVPATYYQNQFRNENGNQNIQLAFEDIMHERDIKERLDTKQYLRHKASYPLSPDEIFIKYDGNSFPVKNLEDRLSYLKSGAINHSVGRIAYNDSRNTDAYWIEDFDVVPLMDMEELGEDNKNKEGAIVQYETPNKDKPKRIPGNKNPMYLTFIEPVRNDKGSSYVYAYVWKFWDYANPERMQNNIVMEWFGRFDNDNDKNFKRVFEMAAYYGSNIFPEVNNDAIVGVARNTKKTDWLQPSLGYVEGLEVNSKKEYQFGKYISPGESPGLEKLTNTWLRQSVSFIERIDGDRYTREDVIMADTLNSQMLCSQLIAYNRDGNYDAYDGIRLLALWNKANEGIDSQYSNSEKDIELLKTMKGILASRNTGRRRAYQK